MAKAKRIISEKKLKECSICTKEKHIGFTNYETRQKYRLCRQHYNEWIPIGIEVDKYIRTKRINNTKEQTKLRQ